MEIDRERETRATNQRGRSENPKMRENSTTSQLSGLPLETQVRLCSLYALHEVVLGRNYFVLDFAVPFDGDGKPLSAGHGVVRVILSHCSRVRVIDI